MKDLASAVIESIETQKRDFQFLYSLEQGIIIPILGDIMRMPSLPEVPMAENIHIDKDGNISGLS